MLSAYDLLLAGVAFSVLLAGFLAGCAIILFVEDNRAENATGRDVSPSLLGFDDNEAQIALGGGATEHPHCNAPHADFAGDDLKSLFHIRKDAR